MTLRERFEAVLAGKKPDAMPYFGDLTYWHFAHEKIGDMPPAWAAPRGIGQMHRDLGVGEYVGNGCGAYMPSMGTNVRMETRQEGDELHVTWHTPVGSLHQMQRWSAESYSWGFLEHPVKEVEDLKVLRYICEQEVIQPNPGCIDRIARECGDYGVAITQVPGSPITELNKTWSGVMTLCYLLADNPVEVKKTLQAIGESQDRIWELTEQCNCPYVMICENLAGDTMGGYFDEFIAPYMSRRLDGLHRHGKKALMHIDGKLHGVLEKVQGIGLDCTDAIVPEPVGDIAVEDLRKVAGDKIILLGGLPGAMFAPPFTAADMERHVRKIIDIHKDSGKFILGIADQVPPNGDLKLVKLVADLVEEYGRY